MILYFAYGSNMDKEDLDKWYYTPPLLLNQYLASSFGQASSITGQTDKQALPGTLKCSTIAITE